MSTRGEPSFLDRLVPDQIRNEPESRRRAAMVVAIALISAVAVGVVSVVHFVRGGVAAGVIAATCATALLLLAFSLRRASLDLVANLCILVWVAMLSGAIVVRGLGTPPAMALAALPMFAVMLVGRRAAMGWGAVVLAIYALVLTRHLGGGVAPELLTSPARDWVNAAAGLVFLGTLAAVGLEYERRKEQAMARVASQAEQLRIAEQAKAEAEAATQIVRAEHLASLGQLAAGAAHEINNPLAYVLANIGVVEKRLRLAGDEDLAEAAQDALLGAKQIQRIVRDLKTYTRTDDDELSPVDVGDVIDSVLKMARNETKHRAQVVREIEGTPVALANQTMLGQVLLNLVINAAQAIPDGRADDNRIVVRAEREGDAVIIEVRDTGMGIAEEIMHRVAEPFFTTKPVGVGTGLGLPACVNLVKRLNGTFSLDSEVGVGTCARVTLEATEAPVAPRASGGGEVGGSARGRVLIIDDDAMVARAIQRMLRAHDVTSVTGGREALDLLASGYEPDLILCDLMMPNMTGVDVHKALVDQHPRLAERLAFISGGVFSSEVGAYLESFQGPIVGKPFSEVELHELIQNACADEAPRRQRG